MRNHLDRSIMRRASRFALSLSFVVAACGGRDTTASSSAGSAELYVHSFVPTPGSSTGASYDRQVTLSQSVCTSPTITIGPCTINPCYTPATPDGGSSPSPNAGTITIAGAQMSALSLDPQPSGYTSNTIDGQIAWTTGGEAVSFEWTNAPGNPAGAGGSVTLATPPYIALTPTSAFATATPTLARTQDVIVSWTSDTPPTTADQVAIDLASASTQVVCIFAVSAGTGVIPSAAVALAPAGAGSYNVHSKQGKTVTHVDGSQWTMSFNVDAQARANDGLAKGPVTFE
jgi:hypothetical protein